LNSSSLTHGNIATFKEAVPMRTRKVLPALTAVAFLTVVALVLCLAPTGVGTSMRPMAKVGPQAIPATVAGTNYGLFTCQVGLSSAVCYDPYQIRHAYNIDNLIQAGWDGKGKTIVIIDAFQSPTLVADLNGFNSFYGLPSLNGLGGAPDSNLGTFTQIAPYGLGPYNSGWAGEITLDVEWAHAIAPRANIVLVLAKSSYNTDILAATRYAVDNNLGDVISQSFGENESCMEPDLLVQQHQIFADATLKHMTIFASTGDEGAAQTTCDGQSWVRAASSPASDPLVTAVGGTELHATGYCLLALGCDPTTNPPAGTYQSEIAWNEFGEVSTGGGFSVLYDEPPYQQGTIHGGKQRGVPDVSYNAAIYHGVLVVFQGGFYLFGGTSSGTPQWAALTAIADQKAGYNLGFINKALYQLGQSKPKYAAAFFDILTGNNSVVELDASSNPVTVQGFTAGLGWDATTGLGSPKADQIAADLYKFVSPGDSTSAVATTKPHPVGKPTAPGYVKNH
jgi:subtilase family serine protease